MTTTDPNPVLAERDRLRELVIGHGAEDGGGSGYDFTDDSGDFDYWHNGRQYNVTVRTIANPEE